MCMLSPKAYANYVQFEKELEGFKAFDKGNKTTRLNPIIRYQEKCWSYFYEFAKQFGLSPLYEKRIGGIIRRKPSKRSSLSYIIG